MDNKHKALEIMRRLYKDNPYPKVELNHTNPFELLVATILSAQSTDKVINSVTPELFSKYKSIQDYANAPEGEIDNFIKKVNFHNNKAKNIQAAAKMIIEQFDGKVPETMEALDSLPGVARKTANVILGAAFGKAEGIVIDTHGIRLANKFGLTHSQDPVIIESELMKLIPKENWIDFGHLLTLHGRYMCKAKAHSCDGCPLGDLCPEYETK